VPDIFGDVLKTDGLSLSVAQATPLTFAQWTEAVQLVSNLSVASPWWTGDVLLYGSLQYGEKYAQGIPEGLSPTTLRGYQWVCERVPPANRHPNLSWSHHRAVAALDASEQARLLEQAEDEGLSVTELRRLVKGSEAPSKREKVVGVAIDRMQAEDGSEMVWIKLECEWPEWMAADSKVALSKP